MLCGAISWLGASGVLFSAQAASSKLVWKPYLQQVTATSVIVFWTTSAGNNPLVRYSSDASYGASATGSSRTLDKLNTRLHRVALTGLQPNTAYRYQIVIDGENLLPGESLTFRTAPATGSSAPFSFLAFGDYGWGSSAQKALRDQMLRERFDFILTAGDNAYFEGTYAEFDSNVFQIYRDVFPRAPVFPSIGNHDTYTEDGAPYLDLFELPRNAWRSQDAERYYSFDYGNAHIVMLDSTAPLDVDDAAASDDMLDWLRDDLRRTQQPWKIVVSHHPAYSTGTSHGSDARSRSKLVPIYEQAGVALVLSGDDHIYLRTKPLRNGAITSFAAGGVTYVIAGGGAKANYGCGNASYVAARQCSRTFGIYARVSVADNCLTVQAVRDTGAQLDTTNLCRNSTTTATATATSTPTASATIPASPPPSPSVTEVLPFDPATPSATPNTAPVGTATSTMVPPVAAPNEHSIWLPLLSR